MIIRGFHGLRWCDYQFSVPLLRESLQLPLLFQLMQSRDGKCHERWSFLTQLGNQLRLRLSLDRMQHKMVDTNSVLCFSHSLPFIASESWSPRKHHLSHHAFSDVSPASIPSFVILRGSLVRVFYSQWTRADQPSGHVGFFFPKIRNDF